MTMAALGGAVLGPLDRLAAALVDPGRRERTAAQLLLAYVAVWTLYGVLAKASQDVHFDMGEAVAWSREPAWGYSKHPPLSAWVVKAWFAIFPLAAWITVAAGALVLAPHLFWLLAHGSSPFDYALDKHPARGLLDAVAGAARFLAGGAAYVAAPIVLAAAATLPNAAAIRDTLWPATAHRRLAALAFWAPLCVAVALGVAAQVLISSLWLMSAVTLLGVVLLSSPLV